MMPTTTLQPGAVTLEGPGDPFTPHVDSVVVGSPPQWSDASDATYATIHRKFHDTEPWTGTDTAKAAVGSPPDGSVTAVTVTIRASSSTGTGDTRPNCFLASATYGAFLEDVFITRDDTVQTVTGAFLDDDPDPDNNSLAQAGAALAEGAILRLSVGAPFGADLTIYEVTVTVTTTTTVEAEEIRVTRQFPRDDAYGLGSAPRIFPPPRGGRLVGGYQ